MWPPLAAGGGGVVVGLVVGFSVPASLMLGLICGGVATVVALSRRKTPERVEPTQVGEPWRQRVAAALAARKRFERAIEGIAPGPLRERMGEVGGRLDVAVQECWHVARRGHHLDGAIGELGVPRIRSQLDTLGAPRDGDEERAAIAGALQAQLDAADRLVAVSARTHDRLRLLNARMDEAVARAIELAASSTDATALRPLDADIEGLIVEFQALQAGLEETGRA